MDFQEILIYRKKCIYYDLAEYDKNIKSRLGGNAPNFFDNKENELKDMYFYMTLENPFDQTKQFSIFTPKNFNERIDKNKYPDCASKLIEHPYSEMSDKDIFLCHDIKLSSIILTKIADEKNTNATSFYGNITNEFEITTAGESHNGDDMEDEESVEEKIPHFIKFGGYHFYIQGARFYREELEKDGYKFLFSLDEDGYKDDSCKEYIFSYGAAYMFAKIENEKTENPLFGFWQYS